MKAKKGKKIYQSILLRESYRENGKVKNRTIANLTHCKEEEIEAIELALKHKKDLSSLKSLSDLKLSQSRSVGAVYAIYQVARELGIEEALGKNHESKLALWQVLSRVIEQGSRLSAVRLADTHAATEVLGIRKSFNEEDLYQNLEWLYALQEKIEKKLFFGRNKAEKLKIAQWIYLAIDKNQLILSLDEGKLEEACKLDGCYVIKTDLSKRKASKEVIHNRYKDLFLVEEDLRTMKTGHLEVRPVYLRKENRTRAHVFVVMMALMILRRLREA